MSKKEQKTCKHPLDRILHRGNDKPPICSACGLKLVEPAEEYPDTITTGVLQDFEDYLVNNGFAEVYRDGGAEESIKSRKDRL